MPCHWQLSDPKLQNLNSMNCTYLHEIQIHNTNAKIQNTNAKIQNTNAKIQKYMKYKIQNIIGNTVIQNKAHSNSMTCTFC